jgi:hypothetical protein
MNPFDPAWLRSGEFSVGNDGRRSRIQQVRDELNHLEGRHFVMPMVRDQGHSPSVYYFREDKPGSIEAQYYLLANGDLRTLTLGLSIEKGEDGKRATGDRKMHRSKWDWPRLIALGDAKLAEFVRSLSEKLDRPVSVVIDYHLLDDEGYEAERRTGEYTFVAGSWRKRGAAASIAEVVERLREVNELSDWWSDVWIVADFNETEVEAMSPSDVAKALFKFAELRTALRPRRA